MNEYFWLDEKQGCVMIICGSKNVWDRHEVYISRDLSELKGIVDIIGNLDEDDFYG